MKMLKIGQTVKMPEGTGVEGKTAKIVDIRYKFGKVGMFQVKLEIKNAPKYQQGWWNATWFI